METILIIVVLLLLFGGGGGYYWSRRGRQALRCGAVVNRQEERLVAKIREIRGAKSVRSLLKLEERK